MKYNSLSVQEFLFHSRNQVWNKTESFGRVKQVRKYSWADNAWCKSSELSANRRFLFRFKFI